MLVRYIQPNTRLMNPWCVIAFSLFSLRVYEVQNCDEMGITCYEPPQSWSGGKQCFSLQLLWLLEALLPRSGRGGTFQSHAFWLWEPAVCQAWGQGAPVHPGWQSRAVLLLLLSYGHCSSAAGDVLQGAADPRSGQEAGRRLAARWWGENRLVWDRASLRAVTAL